MRNLRLGWSLIVCLSLLMMVCSKDDDDSDQDSQSGHRSFIICQGAWGLTNGSISIYDWDTKTIRSVQQVGDVLNQGILDGSTLLLASYGNNSLVLFDIDQETVTRNILLDNAGPQAVGLAENKLYISADNVDSILILNRSSLEKIKSLPAGDDPSAVAVYNQKVFIANYAYDHYDAASYTSYYNQGTVTVVDAVTDTIAASIKVGMNPTALLIEQDLIYVLCTGDYGAKNSFIYRINPISLQVIDSLNLETTGVTKITSDQLGNLYSVAFSYTTFTNTIISYSRGLDKTSLKTFCSYGDGITFKDDYILICTIPDYSTPGTLMILQNDLSVVDSVQVGIGPSQIINQ